MAIEVIPWGEASPDDFLLFHHLPKTAGTAVSSGLEGYYGTENYKWFHGPAGAFEEIVSGTKLLAVGGHLHLTNPTADGITKPMVVVTLFRDPVDRVISNYFYLRATESHHLHPLAVENSLKEIYDKGMGRHLQVEDELTIMVSRDKTPAKRLSSAKAMVDSYTFFGLQDQTQVLELLFKRFFQTEDFSIPLLIARSFSRSSSEQVDLETLDLIKAHNLQDIELYKHAKEVYEHKLEEEWF